MIVLCLFYNFIYITFPEHTTCHVSHGSTLLDSRLGVINFRRTLLLEHSGLHKSVHNGRSTPRHVGNYIRVSIMDTRRLPRRDL